MKLEPGDPAPEIGLLDHDGKEWRLADLRGRKVILYFYPTDDTSGCTAQACDFRDSYESFAGSDYLVLGVSPQDADSHARFASKYSLNFPLLIDADHSVAEAYGAWGKRKLYGNLFDGIIRSTFVIDEEGKISHAAYAVKAKGHVGRLKEILAL